ncbi:MAG: polysaccharide deacetylase family protein [Balneolaceae bacterium]|nr:polysaccharide deacetylase family protein [Balneolaceae bacterium]
MNRICIGILNLTPHWASLLDTIGVRYESINFDQPLSSCYSCLIVNQTPNPDQIHSINQYLTHSGSILITKNVAVSHFQGTKINNGISSTIPPVYSNKVAAFTNGTGLIIRWDSNPDQEFANSDYARKRFYFRPMMHPDEIVNTVDKNALMLTLDRILSKLHFHRSLPYIKKWHSPSEKPVFGFRIDSDFGTQHSIQSLYEVSRKFEIPFTWFLHVKAHEEWLSVFREFEDQELALHGYEHGTSDSYEHIYNNIERGYQKMVDAGIDPKGFCVPYGIWNEALGDVLLKFKFEYSSEFTLGYDALPFQPIHKNELHPTLQIPIHPICTGSLNRRSADESEMIEYFEMVLNDKMKSRQPVFFYHHPMQRGISMWEKVFAKVRESELQPITFIEYAQFWRKRNDALIEANYDAENRVLTMDSSNNSLFIQIAFNSEKYRLMPASKTNKPLHSVSEFDWINPDFPSNDEQQELQKGRLNLIKTSLFDWRNRKSL